MSLEYTTLGKCVTQLESALRSDYDEFARYFFGEGFIAEELYEEVLDPKSPFSNAEKTTKLVLQLMRKVKLDPKSYYKFINHLRQDERRYRDIVDILFGIRKLLSPALPPGHTGTAS